MRARHRRLSCFFFCYIEEIMLCSLRDVDVLLEIVCAPERARKRGPLLLCRPAVPPKNASIGTGPKIFARNVQTQNKFFVNTLEKKHPRG
jgi:hypothetical protein